MSIASTDILAAFEAIDEGKFILEAFNDLIERNLDLWIAFDSKCLFSSLSTWRIATDRSIRGDVSPIQYEFGPMTISKVIWIPGPANIDDRGTKTDSSLTQSLQLLMVDGKISFDYKDTVMQSSDRFTG